LDLVGENGRKERKKIQGFLVFYFLTRRLVELGTCRAIYYAVHYIFILYMKYNIYGLIHRGYRTIYGLHKGGNIFFFFSFLFLNNNNVRIIQRKPVRHKFEACFGNRRIDKQKGSFVEREQTKTRRGKTCSYDEFEL